MAQALMTPVIKSGLQPAHKIQVFDVSTSTLGKIQKQFDGIQTADTLSELVAGCQFDCLLCQTSKLDTKVL